MLSTFLYFIVAYSSVVVLMSFIGWASRTKKISNKVVALLITSLLLLPLSPYAKVAVLTRIYKPKLLPAVRDSQGNWGWSNKKIRTIRVLNLSPRRAGIYVLSECSDGDVGIVVRLKHTSKGWEFDNEDVVFSDCGSAKGNTFPPYPDANLY